MGNSKRATWLPVCGFTVAILAPWAGLASTCPDEIGRWPYGIASAVAFDGDVLYVGVGNTLRIIRVEQDDSLTILSEVVLPETPWDIVPSGDLLAVAAGDSGLQLVDVHDPASPEIVGEIRAGGFALDAAVSDGIAWVAVERGGVRGVDIGDPADPVVVSAFRPSVITEAVAVSGEILWVLTYNGLHSFDFTDPLRPVEIGSADAWGARDLTIVGDLAYVAADWNGLVIFDISDPTLPERLGSWADFNSATTDVAVGGSFAYLADIDLAVIDVSEPTSPLIVDRYSTGWGNWPLGVVLQGDRLAVAAEAGGMHVLDLTEPAEPTLSARMDTPGRHRAVTVTGDLAVLVSRSGHLELRTIDLSAPDNPVQLGSADGPEFTSAVDVVVIGDDAFAIDPVNGYHVFDLSDPRQPVHQTSYEHVGGFDGAESWNNRLVTFEHRHDGNLSVFDVAQPASPVEIARFEPLEKAKDMVVAGDHAYVIRERGMSVIDLGAPSGPVMVGEATINGAGLIDLSGSIAVILGGPGERLSVFDVSDPTRPLRLSVFETGYFGRVAVTGDRVLTWEHRPDSCDTITATDISSPEQPAVVGRRCMSEPRFAKTDSSILAMEWYGGLRVLDLSGCEILDPREPSLTRSTFD
jgi:hypothetical protein